MLCIKTKIKESNIHGIGLFSVSPIRKGETIWKYEPSIDILLSRQEIKELSLASQEQFFNYAFLDKYHLKYMLCGDDARFFNHSSNPNCDDHLPDITIALRDIETNEELTVNYYSFYGNIEEHAELFSDSLI